MAHTFTPSPDNPVDCAACPLPEGHKTHRAAVPFHEARPAEPRAGWPTTHAAAAAIAPKYGTVRAVVLAAIADAGERGATDDELEQITGRSHQSLSACRNSLMRSGHIEPVLADDGRALTRDTRHGNAAIAWTTTPEGAAAVVNVRRGAVA